MPLPTRRFGLTSSIGAAPLCVQSKAHDVTVIGDSGPSLCEDGTGVGVDLGEADGPKSGSLQAEVCPADS